MGRFSELVQSVIHESPGSEGVQISPQVEQDYLRLLDLYDEQVGERFEEDFERPGRLGAVREFLDDVPRTILMMRAMFRAIRARLDEGFREVNLVEAGCGTGLLAVAGAAMDERVRVRALDRGQPKVEVTRFFAETMGLSDRVQVESMDLAASISPIGADVLIAEHISRGLLTEMAVQLPRAIRVDPRYVVPYSVQPALFSGFKLFIDSQASGLEYTYIPETPLVHLGEEIVLADSRSPDSVVLDAEIIAPIGLSPLLVGNDITWLSPSLGDDFFRQAPRSFAPTRPVDSMRNHLLGPTMLPGTVSLQELAESSWRRYWGIHNDSGRIQLGKVRVRYPVGYAGRFSYEDPHLDSPVFRFVKNPSLFYVN